MKIFLSGKITGDDNYRAKFGNYQKLFEGIGHIVLNPAMLPDGLEYEQYIHICEAMIDCCDRVILLPDWKDSNGAMYEKEYANKKKISTYMASDYFDDCEAQ